MNRVVLGAFLLEWDLGVCRLLVEAEVEKPALHLSVFLSVSWSAGSRHKTSTELRQALSVLTLMTRHFLGWWPKQGEEWPGYAKRARQER